MERKVVCLVVYSHCHPSRMAILARNMCAYLSHQGASQTKVMILFLNKQPAIDVCLQSRTVIKFDKEPYMSETQNS